MERGWQVAGGGWQVSCGSWQVAGGRCRVWVAGGGLRFIQRRRSAMEPMRDAGHCKGVWSVWSVCVECVCGCVE
jgi:hypothetical protein